MLQQPAFKTLMTASAATLAAFVLAACDRSDERTAGQQVDAAIAQTEQRAQQAQAELKREGAEASAAIKAGAENASNRVENAADKAADAVSQAADQVVSKTADAAITTQVNAELAKDTGLSALRINVDTSAGRVTLSGTAPDAAAKERATRLASGVKGVTQVDNRLELRG